MNISKINMNQLSFGQVKRSAAELAIKQADGDIKQLNEIKRLIDSESDNDSYDVMATKLNHRYKVVKSGSNRALAFYSNFDSACYQASQLVEHDKLLMFKKVQSETDAPKVKALAKEILEACEE